MSFQELNESQFDTTLRLPIRGKTYVVESPDAQTGLWIQEAVTLGARAKAGKPITDDDVAVLHLDDDQEKDLYRRAMGNAYDEMLADGVGWEHLKHAGTTVLIWVSSTRDLAERYWNTGGYPKASTRKAPADRKKKASAKSARRD